MNTTSPLINEIGGQHRFMPCSVYTPRGEKKAKKQPFWVNDAGIPIYLEWEKSEHWLPFAEAYTLAEKHKAKKAISVQWGGATHDLAGIDLDKCVSKGLITSQQASEIVAFLASYTTLSVSETGLHIYIRDTTGLIPEKYDEDVEPKGVGIYRHSKHFAETFIPFGDVKPIRVVTDPAEARAICKVLGVKPTDYKPPPETATIEPPRKPQAHANPPGDKVQEAEAALARLSTARRDDYKLWIDVGMCLSELGDAGLRLWDEWSKGSQKYMATGPDSCAAKWDTFGTKAHPKEKTLRSLFKYANDDDPGGAVKHINGTGHKVDMNAAPGDKPADKTIPADETATAKLPEIRANGRELRDVSHDAMQAQGATGGIFVRGGELVRVKVDELRHASIEATSESALRGMLARAANFYRERTNAEGEITRSPIAPPLEVVRDILSLKAWDFPPIESVIESPAMRPDGTILGTPGYDPATKLFYYPAAGFVMPDIPANPSRKDIDAARELLYDVICEFPFVNEASRDNTIGTTMTLATRAMVDGPVPIPVFDAPQQGTGKTLLTAIAASMATGEAPIAGAAPNDPEEWRKRITTELSTGKRVIVLDNVTGTLNDPSLAAAATSRFWGDRRLGTNLSIRLPARAVWMVTGNNIRVGGDLVRRCYSIRLDAKISRPWQREGFKYKNIEEHVRANRGALIGAALTLARAWVVAGRPNPTGIRMGGYEAWTQVVGGIMQYVGAKNFLDNLTEFYKNADDDTPAWEVFIGRLYQVFGKQETTCGEVFTRFCPDPDHVATEDLSQYVPPELAGLLDFKSKAKFVQRLGYAFKERRGKRHGDTQARVVKTEGDRKTTWVFYVGSEDK